MNDISKTSVMENGSRLETLVNGHFHPNRISAYGAGITLLSLAALQSEPLSYLAPGIFIAGAVCDYIDGKVARTYNLQTKEGAKLDPLMDKVKNGLIGSYMIYNEYQRDMSIVIANIANFSVDLLSQKQRGSIRGQLREAYGAIITPHNTTRDAEEKSALRANYYGKTKAVLQNVVQGAYITAVAYHENISALVNVSSEELMRSFDHLFSTILTVSAVLGAKGVYDRIRSSRNS